MSGIKAFTVVDGLWDDDTQIREVKKWQHTVAFRDSPEDKWRESSLLHCNNCGSALSFGKICCCGLNFESEANEQVYVEADADGHL